MTADDDHAPIRPWTPAEREVIARALGAGFHRMHPGAGSDTDAAKFHLRSVDHGHTDFLYLNHSDVARGDGETPRRGDSFAVRMRHLGGGGTETVDQVTGRVVVVLAEVLGWRP